MVLINKAKNLAVALFGQGTVRVAVRPAKEDAGVILELEQCKPTAIGVRVDDSKRIKKKIELFFISEESIDIVIQRLTRAKELLQEAKERSKDGKEV